MMLPCYTHYLHWYQDMEKLQNLPNTKPTTKLLYKSWVSNRSLLMKTSPSYGLIQLIFEVTCCHSGSQLWLSEDREGVSSLHHCLVATVIPNTEIENSFLRQSIWIQPPGSGPKAKLLSLIPVCQCRTRLRGSTLWTQPQSDPHRSHGCSPYALHHVPNYDPHLCVLLSLFFMPTVPAETDGRGIRQQRVVTVGNSSLSLNCY